MWVGQSTEEIFNEMGSMSCVHHKAETSQIPELQQLAMKHSKIFWVTKTRVMDPFYFNKAYIVTPEKWLLRSHLLPENRTTVGISDRTKELKDKLNVIDSISTYVISSLLKVCCICRELYTLADLEEYHDMQFCTRFEGRIADLEMTQYENALHFVRLLPFFEGTRDNFPCCDVMLLTFSILVSYYHFLCVFAHLREEVACLNKNFERIERSTFVGLHVDELEQPNGKKSYEQVLMTYSDLLTQDPYNYKIYSSRAQAFLKLSRFVDSELDCRAIIILNPHWCKGYYGLAQALQKQNQLHSAHLVADCGLSMNPSVNPRDSTIIGQYSRSIKEICCVCQRLKFIQYNSEKFGIKLNPDYESITDLPELIDSNSESDDGHVQKLDDENYFIEDDADLSLNNSSPNISVQGDSLDDNIPFGEDEDDLYSDVPSISITNEVEAPSDFIIDDVPEVNERPTFMSVKESGYRALVELHNPFDAKNEFSNALAMIRDGTVPDIAPSEIAPLKYAYAYSCRQCNTQEDTIKAMNIFQELIETSEYKFPTAYYQLASAYYDLNKFKEALKTLKALEEDFTNFYDVLYWPVLDIKCGTTSETLKSQIEELKNNCDNPPPPDAKCRFEKCTLQQALYYTNVDFKGFISIECNEHCHLEYHISCWKTTKDEYEKSDKEFIDFHCLTPDCDGFIVVVSIIGKSGNVEKIFESEVRKLKTNVKQRKSKLEKKMQIKEIKKKKLRCRTVSQSETVETHEEVSETSSKPASSEVASSNTHASASANEPAAKSFNKDSLVSAKPLYVIKKDPENKVSESKVPKHKEKKKPKKATISIDEFRGNCNEQDFANLSDYQRRLFRLQASKRVVEGTECTTQWFPESQSSQVFNSQKPHSSSADMPIILPVSAQSVPTEILKKCIYERCESLLRERKTLDINDPNLKQELYDNSPDFQKVIDKSGGIEQFLLENSSFAVVNGKVCLFSDMMNLYNSSAVEKLEDFSQVDGSECNFELSNDLNNQSFLNPHAIEYSPHGSSSSLTLPDAPLSNHQSTVNGSNVNETPAGGDVITATDDTSFYDSFSKLRMPLSTLSSTLKAKNVPNGEVKDSILSSSQFDAERFVSKLQLFLKLSRNSGGSVEDIAMAFFNAANMINSTTTCEDIVKCFPKEVMRVCVDKYVQLYPPKVASKGTMKMDNEFEHLREENPKLISENIELIEKQKLLEIRLEECMDNVVQLQNKLSIEIPALEKSLEEAHESKAAEYKTIKIKLDTVEKEFRQCRIKHQSLVDSKKECKEEITRLQLKVIHLNSKITDMNKKCEAYDEKISNQSYAKENFDKLVQENNIVMEKKSKEVEEASERARKAELELVLLKKSMYLQKLDNILAEGQRNIQILQRDIDNTTGDLQPFLSTSLKMLLCQIKKHSQDIYQVRMDTEKKGDAFLKKLKEGQTLSDLGDYTYPSLPALPDMTNAASSFMPQMECAKPPTLPSPQTNLSTVRSPLPSMTSETTSHAPVPQPMVFDPFSPVTLASTNEQVKEFFQLQTPYQVANEAGRTNTYLESMNYIGCANSESQLSPAKSTSSLFKESVRKTSVAPPPGLPVLNQTNLSALNKESDVAKASGSRRSRKSSNSSHVDHPDDTASISSFHSMASSKSHASMQSSYFPDRPALKKEKKIVSSAVGAQSTLYNVEPGIELEYSAFREPSTVVKPQQPKPAGGVEKNKSYARLLDRLKTRHPHLSESQLLSYIKVYRGKNKLTGLSIELIVTGITELIQKDLKMPQPSARPKAVINRPLVSPLPTPPEPKRTAHIENPWGQPPVTSNQTWSDETTKCCTICLEEMIGLNNVRIECGHRFHSSCIKQWVKTCSNCPVCRVHILLPEEYPALS